MHPKKKFLFLHSEISSYFTACIQKLVEKYNADVHIVRWPVNREAPFQIPDSRWCRFYEREKFPATALLRLAQVIQPDFIICCGWRDHQYLAVCRMFRKKIPVVLTMDNQWHGTLKQRLALIAGSLLIPGHFTHCWVPGDVQEKYALKLGFKKNNIIKGYYSADVEFFNRIFLKNKMGKLAKFPHRFIFAGRYNLAKGIDVLWNAFIRLQCEEPNDWELWCIGTGDVKPVLHPKIKHHGFVQPGKLGEILSETGVYTLPSRFEPWGVAVHEFAAAGFPLLLSPEVGSCEAFLRNGENGCTVKAGDVNGLMEAMKKFISLPDSMLCRMGMRSNELARQITPATWADTLWSIIK